MRKLILALAVAAVALPALASAQPNGWPNEWPPAEFKWSYLWPINRAETVEKMRLGDEYRKAWGKYVEFATDKNFMGQAPSYFRETDYRADLKAQGTGAFVGRMNIGDVETWKGKGYNGSFKLVGMDPVGPFTCRQAEFTMKNGSGSVSMLRLYCQTADGKWQEIRW